MLKKYRTIIQIALVLAAAFFIGKFLLHKDVLPDRNRASWSHRDGFTAISYGGLAHSLADKGLLPQSRLREHLSSLINAGYTTITTTDILRFYRDGLPLPEKGIYIMFEGGRKDSVLFAHSLLNEFGLNAVLFVYTDRMKGWNRFFMRADELKKIADNPLWEIGSMGHHHGSINQKPNGLSSYFMTDFLRNAAGEATETTEVFRERIRSNLETSQRIISELTGAPSLAYAFMPANTLGVSLAPEIEQENVNAIEAFFPLAFTREGESFNFRHTNVRALTRLQVSNDWGGERLLKEIESSAPATASQLAGPYDKIKWREISGALAFEGNQLILTAQPGRNAFARLRGTENMENVACHVTLHPSPDGMSLVYLRYKDPSSFLRAQVATERILVQEKLDTQMNTLLHYPLSNTSESELRLSFTLKANRLLLQVDGTVAGEYPIPLSTETRQGGFALEAIAADGPFRAIFEHINLQHITPVWIEVPKATESALQSTPNPTALILPREAFTENNRSGMTSLLMASTKGISCYVSVSENMAFDPEDFPLRPEKKPRRENAASLLHGIVLSISEEIDVVRITTAIDSVHAKGLEVALRLSGKMLGTLLQMPYALNADWLLIDHRPLGKNDQVKSALENKYDKSRILFRLGTDETLPEIFAAYTRN